MKFSVVWYGNVMGSRGSILHNFINQKKTGEMLITNENMTRFNILLEDAIMMVNWVLVNSIGGEIFIPKIPSFNVKDLAKAVCDKYKIKIVGIRPGEKLHEEMISIYDSKNTVDLGKFYAILPDYLIKAYQNKDYKLVKDGFFYNSQINKHFLNIKDLKKIIQKF